MAGSSSVTRAVTLAVVVVLGGGRPASAEGGEKIRDNLFLLEEAYNQEPGVIQHIQSFQYAPRRRAWSYGFTEEWPVPTDRHQVSITVAALRPDRDARAGLGDLLLNYRVQALGMGGRGRLAIAPRVSLVLPTGDARRGEGRGGVGVQLNLPVSVDLGDHFVVHANAGTTVTARAQSPGGRGAPAVDTSAGIALVWLPLTWANVVLETLFVTTDVITETGRRRDAAVVVNPGVRFAVSPSRELQIVPGLSAPVAVWPAPAGAGVLAYLSIEHRLW